MPEDHAEASSFEPPKFRNERTSFGQRLKNLGGRIMQFVRPESRRRQVEPQSPAGFHDMERQQKLEEQRRIEERNRRISEQGCAVRSIMSAVACATGRRNIYDDEDAWKSIVMPTDKEWDARLKQIDEGRKSVEELSDDLIKLYTDYAKNDSLLGSALKLVDITKNENQSEEQIKAGILKGEQIMVFTPDINPELSHIFHAGLDKKDRKINIKRKKIICLSDPKFKKRKYQRAKDLSGKTYTTFSVTLRKDTPQPETPAQAA